MTLKRFAGLAAVTLAGTAAVSFVLHVGPQVLSRTRESHANDKAQPQISIEDVPRLLADVDHNGKAPEIAVRRVASLLSQLSNKYGDTTKDIAVATVDARLELVQQGIDESCTDMMESLNQLEAPGAFESHLEYPNLIGVYTYYRARYGHGESMRLTQDQAKRISAGYFRR